MMRFQLVGAVLALQAALTATARGQDSNSPSPWQVSGRVCTTVQFGRVGSLQRCLSTDGVDYAKPLAQVRWTRATPGGGIAVYGSVDASGNLTGCAGPAWGAQWGPFGASVSPSLCVQYRGNPGQDPGNTLPADAPIPAGSSQGPPPPLSRQEYDAITRDAYHPPSYDEYRNRAPARTEPTPVSGPTSDAKVQPVFNSFALRTEPALPDTTPGSRSATAAARFRR